MPNSRLEQILYDLATTSGSLPGAADVAAAGLTALSSSQGGILVNKIYAEDALTPELATCLRAHPFHEVRQAAWEATRVPASLEEWNARAAAETHPVVRARLIAAAPAGVTTRDLGAALRIDNLETTPKQAGLDPETLQVIHARTLINALPDHLGDAAVEALRHLDETSPLDNDSAMTQVLLSLRVTEDAVTDERVPALCRVLLAASAYAPAGLVAAPLAQVVEQVADVVHLDPTAGIEKDPVAYEHVSRVKALLVRAMHAMCDVPYGRERDLDALLAALKTHLRVPNVDSLESRMFTVLDRVDDDTPAGFMQYAWSQKGKVLKPERRRHALWVRCNPDDITDALCIDALRTRGDELGHLVVQHLGERARDVLEPVAYLSRMADTKAPAWLFDVHPQRWATECRQLDDSQLRHRIATLGKGATQRSMFDPQQRLAARAYVRADLLTNPMEWGTESAAKAAAILDFTSEDYLALSVQTVREAGWMDDVPQAREAMSHAIAAAIGDGSATEQATRLLAMQELLETPLVLADLTRMVAAI